MKNKETNQTITAEECEITLEVNGKKYKVANMDRNFFSLAEPLEEYGPCRPVFTVKYILNAPHGIPAGTDVCKVNFNPKVNENTKEQI